VANSCIEEVETNNGTISNSCQKQNRPNIYSNRRARNVDFRTWLAAIFYFIVAERASGQLRYFTWPTPMSILNRSPLFAVGATIWIEIYYIFKPRW